MTDTNGSPVRKRKRRWGDAPVPQQDVSAVVTIAAQPMDDTKTKALALKESVAARLAALKAKKAGGAASHGLIAGKRAFSTIDQQDQREEQQPTSKKAKNYDLDMTITGPTFKPDVTVQKPKINPYLAHYDEEGGKQDIEGIDQRLLRASKPRQRHKQMHFIEPGTFIEIGERKRQKASNALQSGFASGRKAGTYVQSAGMADTYGPGGDTLEDYNLGILAPRMDCGDPEKMPLVMEWWDTEMLPAKLRKQVQTQESEALLKNSKKQLKELGTKTTPLDDDVKDDNITTLDLAASCYDQAALSYSKTAGLVQHIVPIGVKPKQEEDIKAPTLFLTKRELKRQRKLRRAEKQRELQDMQAAGLIPAPEPKLTLSNFIRVLGDQAYLDPSQMEQKVNEQVQARQKAHMDRNDANKLTKEQRAEKLARKLHEDTSGGVSVAIFYVKDMSHTYHRTKVDLNAQQNGISGGTLECQNPSLACVICEGGPKAVKRYTRLMLVRMKWTGPDDEEDDDDDGNDDVLGGDGKPPTQRFNPDNKCELVWTGMSRKRLFKGFQFQVCDTSETARKVLANKGVGHYWDQVMAHASGQGEAIHLKLAGLECENDGSDTAM
jgi:U4/U6 small nuclear ribonucleoprotein PRP3